MKLNKIIMSFAVIAGMTMASCSEGKYWDEVSPTVDAYGFAKTAETVIIPAADDFPTSYTIQVRRSSAGPEVTIPVQNTANNDFMSGPESVTFAAGSMVADYTITIAPGGDAGIEYVDVITIKAPEDASIKEDATSLSFRFALYHELNWVNAGIAKMSSTGIFDTENEEVDVQVQVAVNWPKEGEKLCRLVSPFHALDPKEIAAGHDIEFYLDEYNEPLKNVALQYTGYMEDEIGFLFFGTSSTLGGKFTSNDNHFTMRGALVASSTENASDVDASQAWNQSLKFTWNEYDWTTDQYGK